MQKKYYLCSPKVSADTNFNAINNMKDLGIILVLLGVLMLVLYFAVIPSNWLLVISLVLEVAGILGYIFLNRRCNK